MQLQTKPVLFDNLRPQLQPVLNFQPAPLADALIQAEIFSNTLTLTGTNDKVEFITDPVPTFEVHRYFMIAIHQNHGSNRKFALNVRAQRGTVVAPFIDVREVLKDVANNVPTDLLSNNGDLDPATTNWNGNPLDLYPGMSLNVCSKENLSLLSTHTMSGYRLKMRGPETVGMIDVSAEVTATES